MQPTHRYIVFNCKVGDSNSEIFNFQGKKKKNTQSIGNIQFWRNISFFQNKKKRKKLKLIKFASARATMKISKFLQDELKYVS